LRLASRAGFLRQVPQGRWLRQHECRRLRLDELAVSGEDGGWLMYIFE
jgi:hypothetical protein